MRMADTYHDVNGNGTVVQLTSVDAELPQQIFTPITVSLTPQEKQELIVYLNKEEVQTLLPLIFTLAFILLIGVIGNVIVLLVYCLRYKRSPARVYILFLASIDLSICTFGLPYHIIDLTHPYTYTSGWTCKSLTFIISLFFHMSIFGLIVISIDRYLKICHPLNRRQISFFGKRRACFGATVLSFLFAWPNLIIYGPSVMETKIPDISGPACFFDKSYSKTMYPLVYTIVTLSVCLVSTCFMIVTYSLICHQIITRYKCNPLAFTENEDTMYTEDIHLKTFNVTIKETNNSPIRSHWPLRKHQHGSATVCYTSADTHASQNECSVCVNHSNGSWVCPYSSQNTDHINDSNCVKNTKHCEKSFETIRHVRDSQQNDHQSENLSHLFNWKDIDSHSVSQHVSKGYCLSNECLANHNRTASTKMRGEFDSPSKIVKNHTLQCLALKTDLVTSCFSNDIYLDITSGITSPKRRGSEEPRLAPKRIVTLKRSNSLTLSPLSSDHFHHIFRKTLSFHGSLSQRRSQSIIPSSRSSIRNRVPAMSGQHLKVTKIMITVTLVFILSHAPTFVVAIWSTANPEFWDNLSIPKTILCEFLLRMYLLNNICNPFIYGFWDRRFNREVKIALRKLYNTIVQRIRNET